MQQHKILCKSENIMQLTLMDEEFVWPVPYIHQDCAQFRLSFCQVQQIFIGLKEDAKYFMARAIAIGIGETVCAGKS
jgi:hypothetical protein